MGSPVFHPTPVAAGFYADGNGSTGGFTAAP